MSKHEIIDLLFQSFESIQTAWGIFTTVLIGILAAIVSFPEKFNSILARFILIISFFLFSYINRTTVTNLAFQRCELRVAACEEFNIKYLCKYNCGNGQKNEGYNLDESNYNSSIELDSLGTYKRLLIGMIQSSPAEVSLYHWIQTILLILLIWFVPRQLVRLRPSKEIMERRVRILGTDLPNPLIKFNSIENMWELMENITIKKMYLDDNNEYELFIEKGFLFDLASVPRILWPLIAPFELSIIAPLVHDYLYILKGRLYLKGNILSNKSQDSTIYKITRDQADSIFLAHMRDEKIGKIKSKLAYWAVNFFGWKYWKEIELSN